MKGVGVINISGINIDEDTARIILRAIVDSYVSIQKIRIGANNRVKAILRDADEYEPIRIEIMSKLIHLKQGEKEYEKLMRKYLKYIDVYNVFLKHVKGVGDVFSGKLLALPLDINKPFESWLAYFCVIPHYYECVCIKGHKFMYSSKPDRCRYLTENGICGEELKKVSFVKQAPRRKKGYQMFWNPKARTLYYLIATSFILLGDRGFYGRLFRKVKERVMKDLPEDVDIATKKRKISTAYRVTFKVFLSNLYEAWCETKGIEPKYGKYFKYLMDKGVWISYKDVLREGG